MKKAKMSKLSWQDRELYNGAHCSIMVQKPGFTGALNYGGRRTEGTAAQIMRTDVMLLNWTL